MEYKDFKANEDKTFSILADSKEMRLVPETDLIGLKTANSTREEELKGSISKVEALRNEEHANLLKLQATHETIQKQLAETMPFKDKAKEWETKHTELSKTVKPLEDELATRVRDNIISGWKVDQKKLDGKSLSELRQMESTLKLIGPIRSGAGYDIGGNGSGAPPANSLEAATQEIAAARNVGKSVNTEHL